METAKQYTPSNGTEGMIFYSNWCDRCSKEKRCPILTDKVIKGHDSKKTEWIFEDGKPICKAFKKIGTSKRQSKEQTMTIPFKI